MFTSREAISENLRLDRFPDEIADIAEMIFFTDKA